MALRYATVTGNSLPCCPRVVRQREVYWHILKMKMEHVTKQRRVSRVVRFLVSTLEKLQQHGCNGSKASSGAVDNNLI